MKEIQSQRDGMCVDGPSPTIHESSRIRDSTFGEWTLIQRETKIVDSTIREYTYLMERAEAFHSDIGKFCSIAANTRVNATDHPTGRVTSHPITYRGADFELGENDEAVFEQREDDQTELGHDVWVGHGAVIMPGITVGNGAVIGSGAVVTDDVEPYAVVGGVPAERIRWRFPESVIEAIEEAQWWDWPRCKLEENMDLLRDPQKFVERS